MQYFIFSTFEKTKNHRNLTKHFTSHYHLSSSCLYQVMINLRPHPHHPDCMDLVDTNRQSTRGLLKSLRSPLDVNSSRPSSYPLICIASGQEPPKHPQRKQMRSHHHGEPQFFMKNFLSCLLLSIIPVCPRNLKTPLKFKTACNRWWYPCTELRSCMIKLPNLWPQLHLLHTNPPLLGLSWCSRSGSSFAQL